MVTTIITVAMVTTVHTIPQYYVRARHMSLKALDVTYTIPTLGDLGDILDQSTKKVGCYGYH